MRYKPSFFRPPHGRLLIGASLAINLLALALPLMTMQIYDRVMPNRSTDTLFVLSCGVLIAALAEICLRIARSFITGISAAQFEHEAASTALSRLLHTDPRRVGDASPAVLMQDIGAASRLKDYYGGQMAATLLVDAPFALLFLGLAFYLTGPLAYATLAVLGVVVLVMGWQGIRLRRLAERRERQDNIRYDYITQSLQAVHTVKALCAEAVTVKNFAELQRPGGTLTYEMTRLQGRSGIISYFAAQIMTVTVVCLGAPLAIEGRITIGMLAACIMLSGQVMQPVMRSLNLWLRFQEIRLARRRLASLLALPPRCRVALDSEGDAYDLKLESVSFGFKPGQPVLRNLSLAIKPGEVIAIQGAASAGKTVLLELMAGIYVPDEGHVLLGGRETSSLPPSTRAHRIGYLSAQGAILRGSIMDNMTGFDSRLEPAAHGLAEMLGIERAVALLPSGYDTPLEGLAADLVGPGFKQRLSIIRALLHHPRFIIYDNADQGLDRESYSAVFGLLARLKRKATLVIVSDDRNILSLADHVMELQDGQLIRVMQPAALLAARRSEPSPVGALA